MKYYWKELGDGMKAENEVIMEQANFFKHFI
jgi:hypothetical protein